MKFYLTVENQEKIKNTFINLNAFSIIDVQEILMNIGLDLNKPSDQFYINDTIKRKIESVCKSKRLQGIIYINRNLNSVLISHLNDTLKEMSRKVKNFHIEGMVLMDRQYFPKLKYMWKDFEEVMFFPEIKKIKIVECQSLFPENKKNEKKSKKD